MQSMMGWSRANDADLENAEDNIMTARKKRQPMQTWSVRKMACVLAVILFMQIAAIIANSFG